MGASDFAALLREFGYPALVFFGTGFVWWRAVRWARPHVEGAINDYRALAIQATASVVAMETAANNTNAQIQGLAKTVGELANTQGEIARMVETHDHWARDFARELRREKGAKKSNGEEPPCR